MKITNNYNLPQALVDLVANSQYAPKEKSFSATTLLNPTQQTILTKYHWNEIEVDVAERVNTVLGTATHSLIEKFDKTGYAEMYLKQPIKDGYYLTGKCDLYDKENQTLVDYKTATCWKIIYKDFEDWRKQGLIYSWLLIKLGYVVKKIKFHAILKDWTARELRLATLKGDFYPQTAVYTYELNIKTSDLVEIEQFIYDKFDELIKADTSDELPLCTNEETWYTGDKYAVYKNETDKRATKLCESEEEANGYIENVLKGKGVVIKRVGEHRRCEDYCDVCQWCKQNRDRQC